MTVNTINPTPLSAQPCPVETDPVLLQERYQEFLGDESRLRADEIQAVFFPETPQQVADAFSVIRQRGWRCVLSGARTGIAGGAAPIDADAVLSCARMKQKILLGNDGDEYYARLSPNVPLADLDTALRRRTLPPLDDATPEEQTCTQHYASGELPLLWLPVDPTEQSASVGGIVSTNASGARTYRYGATRNWVRALSVVLPDGRLLHIRRGTVLAHNSTFCFVDDQETTQTLTLPQMPIPNTKHTLGYPCHPQMDLIDLFIGAEGTLGMIVEVELRLVPRPAAMLGLLLTLPDENAALDLVQAARVSDTLPFEAIEYFDHDALALLRQKRDSDGPGSEIPDLPCWDGAALYLELAGTEDDIENWFEPLELFLSDAGLSLDDTWAATEPEEWAQQKAFRHALPEAVNTLIGQRKATIPALHKVGTDMAVPDECLCQVMALYRAGLADAGLESVVFGHIGNNHVHVNILPRSEEELLRAKELYLTWADAVVKMGGAVAAEHGIGRIKRGMLERQYSPAVLDGLRSVRRVFDPHGLLAPGVLV